jgi:hypothetical protein
MGSIWVDSCLKCKYQTRLKSLVKDNHSSLSVWIVSDKEKQFYEIVTRLKLGSGTSEEPKNWDLAEMEERALNNVNNCWNTNISFNLETFISKCRSFFQHQC